MKKLLLTILGLACMLGAAHAQYGILDPSFGNGTPAGTDLFITPGVGTFQFAVAIQGDGKILLGNGGEPLGLGRLNSNGLLDATFGNGGWDSTGLFALESLVPLGNGQILAAGKPTNISYGDIYVWRFNADGSHDETFGYGGRAGDSSMGAGYERIALQGSNIIFSGASAVKRLDSSGITDASFGNNGFVRGLPIYTSCSAVDSNLRIVLGGYTPSLHVALIRLTADGQLDPTFGAGGIDSINESVNALYSTQAVRVTPAGKVILASDYIDAFNNNHVVLAQFNASGAPDNTFGGTGIVYPDWGTYHGYEFFGGIALGDTGQVLVASSSLDSANLANNTDIAILRFNSNGALDTAFGKPRLDIDEGVDNVEAIAVGPDGKPVVNGSTYGIYTAEVVARFTIGYPSGITGVTGPSLSLGFYPNPVGSAGTLSFTLPVADMLSAAIYSMDGRMVRQVYQEQKMEAGTHTTGISLTGMAAGMYQVVLTGATGTAHVALVRE